MVAFPQAMPIFTQNRTLAVILLLALALRLGFSLPKDSHRAALRDLPDQDGYIECARQWFSGNGWRLPDERFGQWVYAVRTPGYPAFLMLCNNATVRCARGVQALIDTSTALAAYLLARRLLGSRAALLAAAIVAFNPFLIYFSSLILTETLFTAMVAWSLYLLICHRWFVRASILLALAAMVRPSGLPFALLLPPAAALALGLGLRRTTLNLLLSALITAAVFAPWALRNRAVLGQWVWTTTNDGITAYDGLNPSATGASDQSFVKDMPELKGMSELQRNAHFAALARQFVHDHPAQVLRLAVVKAARTWSPIPLSQQFGSSRLYTIAGLGYALPLFLLALLGFAVRGIPLDTGLAWNWRIKLFLLVPAILLTLIHASSVGSLRYRMPAEPQLAILAAAGILPIARCLTAGRRPLSAS